MLDILIRGGWVIDGTGNPRRRLDVGIRGKCIACMERNIPRRRGMSSMQTG